MNPIDAVVGRNLRNHRIKCGLSQESLGDAVGVSFQQIQKYESGSNRISASRLVELAGYLNIPLTDLFEDVAGEMKQVETRTLRDRRREQSLVENYNKMPDDIREAIANLCCAITMNLGNTYKGE